MRNVWLGALALLLVLSGLNLAPWSDAAGEQGENHESMGVPHPLAGNLVAHWLLDEGSGQYANDTGGNNNNGTLLPSYPGNAPAWTSGGISGNALMFDGVDDYVETPNIGFSGNVPLSIAFWAKVNVIVITNNFVSVGYRSELNLIGIGVGSTANTLFLNTWGGLYNLEVDISPVTTTAGYFFIAYSYDGTTERLWANGELKLTRDIPYSFSNNPVRIGGKTGGYNGQFLNGTIDEVSIWSRAAGLHIGADAEHRQAYSSGRL